MTTAGKIYHQARIPGIGNQQLHRLVASAFIGPSHLHVDHIDGNPENNRPENLRYCTHRENLTFENYTRRAILPGVYKNRNRYQSRVVYQGKRYNLGYYSTPEQAHAAYLQAFNLIEYGREPTEHIENAALQKLLSLVRQTRTPTT